jgi:hypothetical protein
LRGLQFAKPDRRMIASRIILHGERRFGLLMMVGDFG